MEERRKTPRRRALKGAKIIFNAGTSVVDCTVRNFSSDGALLLFPSTLGVPSSFDLVLEGETKRVACEVTWRHEQRLGVRFSDASAPAAARS